MATKEELYVRISQNDYRINKSNVLTSQADFLIILKRLYKLKVLARQKEDYKKKLHKLFASILSDIDSIQNKMPTSKVPKTVQKEEVEKVTAKRDFSKYKDIEEELKLVQQKLRELNS